MQSLLKQFILTDSDLDLLSQDSAFDSRSGSSRYGNYYVEIKKI